MRCLRESSLTHIIALLAVFATLTGFSMTGTESMSTVISFQEEEDGLSQLVYHFPDQAAEPAILNNTDDSDYSIFRFAHHRFFDILRPVGSGNLSSFLHIQSHSTVNSFNNKSIILVKLRI